MRILFFIGVLITGGAERQIAVLANGLAKRGYHVVVATLYPGGQNWKWLQSKGNVHLISLFSKKTQWKFLKIFHLVQAIIRLRSLTRREQVSVVYSVMEGNNIIAWLAMRGVHTVKLIWGIRSSNDPFRWKRELLHFFCRLVSGSVPLLVANSKAGLAYIESKGYQCKRQIVVTNGIDIDEFQPNPKLGKQVRSEWGIAENEKLIGIVGRLKPKKDHATFLKAAALLANKREDVRFVCVGYGTIKYRQELQELAKSLGLEKQVIWSGERSDMPSVYNALDAMVSSSSCGEGFSNVVGEAMACGIPCVVTDVGDSAWIVGNTGFVVPPKDPLSLFKALDKLLELSSEERKKLGEAARKRIVEHFSLPVLVDRYEVLFKNFI